MSHTERESRLLQLAIDNAPEIIFCVGADATLLAVNEMAVRRLEYDREELLAMRIYDIDPDYPPHLWPTHWKTICTDKRLVVETVHRTKTGRLFPVEVSIQYFELDDQGYCTSVIRDITERKQAQEALSRKQAEILELSAPILKIAEGVIVVPIVGVIDAALAGTMMEKLLAAIVEQAVRRCILDLSGVYGLDAEMASHLLRIAAAARLLGSQCLLSGISSAMARTLVENDIEVGEIQSYGSLKAALAAALKESAFERPL